MPFCREQTIQASSQFGEIVSPVKCRAWTCELCAPWRQRQLQARCIEGKPNRFLTITCRAGQFGSPEANAKAIAHAWRTCVQRWRRQRKYHRCEYICVFEPHVSGWPHLHILWSGHWIDQRWLSKQMKELLNSPVVHVSFIKGQRSAAFYVTEYFSKTPTKFGTSKRYWTSGKWPKCERTDAPRVYHKNIPTFLVNEPVESIIATWRRHGKQVFEIPPDLYGWGLLWMPPARAGPKRAAPIRSYDGDAWFKTNRGWRRA